MLVAKEHSNLYTRFLKRNGETVKFIGDTSSGNPAVWLVECIVSQTDDMKFGSDILTKKVSLRFKKDDIDTLLDVMSSRKFPHYNSINNEIEKVIVRDESYFVGTQASLNTFGDLVILSVNRGNG